MIYGKTKCLILCEKANSLAERSQITIDIKLKVKLLI